MKYVIFLLLLVQVAFIQAQEVQLYQLQYGPDSLHHIGAWQDGEPRWRPNTWLQDSIYKTTSIAGDTIQLWKGKGKVFISSTSGGGVDTQYLEPLPAVGSPKNGFWLTAARDTVQFIIDPTVDYNNTNELQNLSFEGTQGRLYILPLGNSVQLPDSSSVNEIQTPSFSNTTGLLSLTQTGTTAAILPAQNAGTNTKYLRSNGTGAMTWETASGGGSTYYALGSTITATNTTFQTAITAPLVPGNYKVEFVGTFTSSSTATGVKLAFKYEGADIYSNGFIQGDISNAVASTAVRFPISLIGNNDGAQLTTPSVVNTGQSHNLYSILTFTISDSANLLVRFASENTNSTTLQAGSSLIVTKI